MPGYVIHLCVAKEYVKKHNVENEVKFIEGVIYPDSITLKGQTHYSEQASAETNLYKFLLDKKLDSSYNEGYFLHLLSDCVFYNKYFMGWKTIDKSLLYNDYDILNPMLIQKYNLTKAPKGLEGYFSRKQEGQTIEYHYNKVIEFIDEISNYELHEVAEKILLKKDYKFLLK